MKNNFLFCATILTATAALASEFEKQQFTWKYSIQAKNAENQEHFAKFNNQLYSMIHEMNRSANVGIYQQMVVFVKELQEAILAGFNLFGSVTTSQQPVSEIVTEAAAAVVEEVVAQDDQADTVVKSESEKAIPAFSIVLICSLLDKSQQDHWNLATAMLQDLCDHINTGSMTPDEIVSSLNDVYDILIQMEGSGISLTSASVEQA